MSTADQLTAIDVALCLETVRQAAPHLRRTPDPGKLLALDKLEGKLLAAFDQLAGLERAEYAVGLWRYCMERGLFNECLNMLIQSRVVAHAFPFALRTEGALAVGAMCQRMGRFEKSLQALDVSWQAAQLLNAPAEKAFIKHHFGTTYRFMGRLDTAVQQHLESIALAEEAEDWWIVAAGNNALGAIALVDLRLEEADDYFVKSGQMFRAIGESRRGLEVLINRAIVAGEWGKYDLAEEKYRECFNVCRGLNDPSLYALCLHNLGDICSYTGKHDEAKSILLRAYKKASDVAYKSLIPLTVDSLARVCFLEGNHKRAVQLFAHAEHLRMQLGIHVSRLEQNEPAKIIARIRSTMRANVFSRYWKEGEQIPSSEVFRVLKP